MDLNKYDREVELKKCIEKGISYQKIRNKDTLVNSSTGLKNDKFFMWYMSLFDHFLDEMVVIMASIVNVNNSVVPLKCWTFVYVWLILIHTLYKKNATHKDTILTR